MAEIMIGGNKFEDIRRNAYWAHASLDTRIAREPGDEAALVKHLQDCYEHPTRGLLAMRERAKNINYPLHFFVNREEFYETPGVKRVGDALDEKFNELYPKSGKSRIFLIKNDNVVLDYVKQKGAGFKRQFFKIFGKMI